MPVILSKELILLFKEKGWSSPNEIFCAEQREKYNMYIFEMKISICIY